MSTQPETKLEIALAAISDEFRSKIIDAYLDVKRKHTTAHFTASHESVGASIGKFCETLIRFLQFEVDGSYTPFTETIRVFPQACYDIITSSGTHRSESIKTILPRSLSFVYSIRNKRGAIHVASEVETNIMDFNTAIVVIDWIMCELIRVYHGLSLEAAQAIVNTLISRPIHVLWELSGRTRIQAQNLTQKEKTLLLAYSRQETTISVDYLARSLEIKDMSKYKTRVLQPLHDDVLIDFDANLGVIQISDLGIREVETNVLPKVDSTLSMRTA